MELGVIAGAIGDEGIFDGHIEFKTWGQDGDNSDPNAWSPEWGQRDAAGHYTRMIVHKDGVNVPHGALVVNNEGYPVSHSVRDKNGDPADGPTRSAFTATRQTEDFTREEMQQGYGVDIGLTITDKEGKDMELGVIAGAIGDEGIFDGHIEFKTWGQDGDNSDPNAWSPEWGQRDAAGHYTRMIVHKDGVTIPSGDLLVGGQSVNELFSQRRRHLEETNTFKAQIKEQDARIAKLEGL